jgi:hypothetical protein
MKEQFVKIRIQFLTINSHFHTLNSNFGNAPFEFPKIALFVDSPFFRSQKGSFGVYYPLKSGYT